MVSFNLGKTLLMVHVMNTGMMSKKWYIMDRNPLMLQNYANEVGLELIGIKRFEDLYIKSRA